MRSVVACALLFACVLTVLPSVAADDGPADAACPVVEIIDQPPFVEVHTACLPTANEVLTLVWAVYCPLTTFIC